jgi:hypothetical protein
MLRTIAVVAMLACSSTLAVAQTVRPEDAYNELSLECTYCLAFYGVAAACVGNVEIKEADTASACAYTAARTPA